MALLTSSPECGLVAVACLLFSVRSDWESVGFRAGAVFSVFGGGLVGEAGVPSHVVVFVVPVGEFDTGVQQTRERVDVQELISLA